MSFARQKGIGWELAFLLAAPPTVQLVIVCAARWSGRSATYAPGLYSLFLFVGVLVYFAAYLLSFPSGMGDVPSAGVVSSATPQPEVGTDQRAWAYSVLCAGTLTVVAIYVTSLLVPVRGERSAKLAKFVTELSEHSFKNVFFFFAWYLCVAYLAGIALASHDECHIRLNKQSALQAAWAKWDVQAEAGAPTAAPSASAAADTVHPCYRIYFEQFSAELLSAAEIPDPIARLRLFKETQAKGQRMTLRHAANAATFQAIKDSLGSVPAHRRIEVTLRGHAKSETLPNAAHGSDFNLATLRVGQVSQKLRRLLEELTNLAFDHVVDLYEVQQGANNASRLCTPDAISSPQHTAAKFKLNEAAPVVVESLIGWYSVDVIITERAGHPSGQILGDASSRARAKAASHGLLTYIYFAVTGRGLIAVTPVARFVGILANTMSVAFLIIILGGLMAACYSPSSTLQRIRARLRTSAARLRANRRRHRNPHPKT